MDRRKYIHLLSEYQIALKRAKIRYIVSSNLSFAVAMIFSATAVYLSNIGWLIGDRGKVLSWFMIGGISACFVFQIKYKPFAGLSELEYKMLGEEWSDVEAAKLISMRLRHLYSTIAIQSGKDFVSELYRRMEQDAAKSLYLSLPESERVWLTPRGPVNTNG